MSANPLDGFSVDRSQIRYIGTDLHRPECILAEPDGTLWAADARGGVMRIAADGSQQLITQKLDARFDEQVDFATRFTTGTLPNGLAFARNGDILISNFGTDVLEVMTRDGTTRTLTKDPSLVLATDGLRTRRDYNHGTGINVLRGDTSVLWRDDPETRRVMQLLPANAGDDSSSVYQEIWKIVTQGTI